MENETFSNQKNEAEFLRQYERFWKDDKTSKFEVQVLKDGVIIAHATGEATVDDKVACLRKLVKDVVSNLEFLITLMEVRENEQRKTDK